MRQCRWPAFRCSQLPHMLTRTHSLLDKVRERRHEVVTLSRMKVTPRNRRLAFVFVSLHWLWQLALQTMRNARNEKQSQTKVMKKRNALYCYLALTRTVRALLLQSPWDCLHLCVSSASDYWRHQPLCVVSECCWHELSPRTSDYRLRTPNNNNDTDTDTESCIHKSMSPPRCCCCCCCSARCVHCTCQLSLRFPLRLLVMDVPMPDHIQISTFVLGVCAGRPLLPVCLSIYLSVCMTAWLSCLSHCICITNPSTWEMFIRSFVLIFFFSLLN